MYRAGRVRSHAKVIPQQHFETLQRVSLLILLSLALGLALAACAGDRSQLAGFKALEAPFPAFGYSGTIDEGELGHDQPFRLAAEIITPKRPLQCVPFARELSRIQIRGDARTWWRQAKGRYARDSLPAVGAVMVLKPKFRSRGHVAVVTEILGDREIVVSHSNWLNKGRIHKNTPVKDVSRNNDWSAVRVWYTPGRRYGARSYPVHGFIYPPVSTAALATARNSEP